MNEKISFVTLFAFVIFFIYIFINVLFPYANIVSASLLAISVGISLYCVFDQNQTLLTIALVSVLLSIISALVNFPL